MRLAELPSEVLHGVLVNAPVAALTSLAGTSNREMKRAVAQRAAEPSLYTSMLEVISATPAEMHKTPPRSEPVQSLGTSSLRNPPPRSALDHFSAFVVQKAGAELPYAGITNEAVTLLKRQYSGRVGYDVWSAKLDFWRGFLSGALCGERGTFEDDSFESHFVKAFRSSQAASFTWRRPAAPQLVQNVLVLLKDHFAKIITDLLAEIAPCVSPSELISIVKAVPEQLRTGTKFIPRNRKHAPVVAVGSRVLWEATVSAIAGTSLQRHAWTAALVLRLWEETKAEAARSSLKSEAERLRHIMKGPHATGIHLHVDGEEVFALAATRLLDGYGATPQTPASLKELAEALLVLYTPLLETDADLDLSELWAYETRRGECMAERAALAGGALLYAFLELMETEIEYARDVDQTGALSFVALRSCMERWAEMKAIFVNWPSGRAELVQLVQAISRMKDPESDGRGGRYGGESKLGLQPLMLQWVPRLIACMQASSSAIEPDVIRLLCTATQTPSPPVTQ